MLGVKTDNLLNSPRVDTFLRLTGLTWALATGLSIPCLPLAAQETRAPQAQEEKVEPQPSDAPSDAPATPAEPATPPPASLRDLIPDSALEEADVWASGGVASQPSRQSATETDDVEVQSVPATPSALEGGWFADWDETAIPAEGTQEGPPPPALVSIPDPLSVDPQLEALAAIDAPDLVELPELEEFKLSDELILAFPKDNDRFPERTNFIERFGALSTIEALDGGEDTIPQLAARARADEDLLIEVLRTYGYYNGEVIRQLSGGRRGDGASDEAQAVARDPQVRFDILPGALYRFGKIDLGELDNEPMPEGGELISAFEIAPGDPLYADRIPEEINDLRVEMGERGYPFASVAEPSLLIDHAREEGDLTLPVEPGGRYVFGGVVSDDPDFLSGRHLAQIARFEPGQAYQASLQADLRRAVLATGLVSTAAITPREVREPTENLPGEVALDVTLERAPLRTVSGAIGYGTEEGFRLEAGWEHRNLLPPEGALRLRGIVGTQEQLASVSFQRSNFRARDQILTIDAYASDIDTDAIDARTIALRGTFEKVSNLLFQKRFSWAVGGEVLLSNERNSTFFPTNQPRQEYLIGGLFGRVVLDGSDDLLDPTTGFRVIGEVAPDVSRTQGRTSFYMRTGVDAAYYKSVGSTVLAGRAHVQAINGAGVSDIAPTRRLYSGGGGAVRGYAFQAIGPRDDDGNPTGGRSLVEFNLEARIQTPFLDGAVEIVPFVDAGSVSTGTTPDFGVIRFGAGVGVRYKTSFGPIRVDVGVPLNPDEFDAPVAVYVSLGQAF